MNTDICPCGSGKEYAACCRRYHHAELLPQSALELMRSRYSAYALGLIDYIIQTTHPLHRDWSRNREEWKNDLQLFSQQTNFQGLEILNFQDGDTVAFVTFKAHLSQHGVDATFTERSRFEKHENRWLYISGS